MLLAVTIGPCPGLTAVYFTRSRIHIEFSQVSDAKAFFDAHKRTRGGAAWVDHRTVSVAPKDLAGRWIMPSPAPDKSQP
jgi:hypothetical protein